MLHCATLLLTLRTLNAILLYRADAVLVIDCDSSLVGIMTDKDLAFRVVAEGLDVHTTLISQVMTRVKRMHILRKHRTMHIGVF